MVNGKLNQFSAKAMFESLERGDPADISVVGFVKPDDSDEDAVQLARPGKCDLWMTIPGDSISRFEPLAKVPCGDHHHHLVRLQMNRPEDERAGTFYDLLGSGQARSMLMASHVDADAQGKALPLGLSATGAQFCYYDAQGRYICVPL